MPKQKTKLSQPVRSLGKHDRVSGERVMALEDEVQRIKDVLDEHRMEVVSAFKGIAEAIEEQTGEIRRLNLWAPTVDVKLERVAIKAAESAQRVEDMSESIEHRIELLRTDVADLQMVVKNGNKERDI